MKFEHARNGSEYIVPNTKYKLDGYNKTYNIGIEYHGDYYHGHPKGSRPNKERYIKTLERSTIIRKEGINLIEIWTYNELLSVYGLETVIKRINRIRRQLRH